MTVREHIETTAVLQTVSHPIRRAAGRIILPIAAFVSGACAGLVVRGLTRSRPEGVDAYLDDASELVELGRRLEAEQRRSE